MVICGCSGDEKDRLPASPNALEGPHGFGFVQCEDPANAEEAKYQINGQIIMGQELTVVFAEENRKKPSEMRTKERIRLNKTGFHVIGAILFTIQSALIHPTAVVKTRMQVAGSGLSQMIGLSVFSRILKTDGIPDTFRDWGTSAIGSLPGRVLALTSLEVSKDITFKHTENMNMREATHVGIANGVAGLISNLLSCLYFVPLDVVSFIKNQTCEVAEGGWLKSKK